MYKKIRLKFFIPALAFLSLLYVWFYLSPFSGEAFLIGMISSVNLIGLSLILNDRSIKELSGSFFFLSQKFVYSFVFFTFLFVLFALAGDRIYYLIQFLGGVYSPKYSFIILLGLGIGGYSCSAFLVKYISRQQPSGVPYGTFLKENALKMLAVSGLILGISFIIALFFSLILLNFIPGPTTRLIVFALMLFMVLIQLDLSGVANKSPHKTPSEPQKNKLYLIGVDAADWKVVHPLLSQDKLPHLKKILEKASYGYLDCFGKRLSPVLWTSFVTGATPDIHGITGFVFHEKGKKESSLFKSFHRKVPALWHILSDAGKKVGVLNWLLSFPAEKVNGFMVSRLSAEPYEGLTHPEQLYAEIAPFMSLLSSQKPGSLEEQNLLEVTNELVVLEKTAAYLLDRYEQDAFIFYTQTTDKIMHKFWHFKEPERFQQDEWELDMSKIKKFGNVIDDHWCQLDRLIGKISQKADAFTNIVIISDHGSKARAKPFLYVDGNKLLEVLGLLNFKADGKEIDFSRTKLYSNDPTIWNTYYAFSLNVRGREKMGIIEKEGFAEERKKIIRQLREFRTKKGKKLFGSVSAVDQNGTDIIATHTSLLRKSNAEVLALEDREVSLKTLLSRVQSDTGNHDPKGLVILSGPSFSRKILAGYLIEYALSFILTYMQGLSQHKWIRPFFAMMKRIKLIDPYTTLDVMPTLLHTMGLPSTEYMPGEVMTQALNEEIKKSLNFCRIKKYDIPIPRPLAEKMEGRKDEEIKEQLRGLGYLE